MGGRKMAADLYGGWGSQMNAPLSGKDGSTVSRAGTYGARWAARSLVDGKLCSRCLVQLSYTPGTSQPVVLVDSYGTAAEKSDIELAAILLNTFDFRPGC